MNCILNGMKNFKICHTILFITIIQTIVFSFALVYSITNTVKLELIFDSFIKKDVAFFSESKNIYSLGLQRGQAVRNIILNSEDNEAKSNFDKASNDSIKLLSKLSLMASNYNLKNEINEISELTNQDIKLQYEIIAISFENKQKALEIINKKETVLWRSIKEKYFSLEKSFANYFIQKQTENNKNVYNGIIIVAIISIFALIINIILSLLFSKCISKKIGLIVKNLSAVSSENLDVPNLEANSNMVIDISKEGDKQV